VLGAIPGMSAFATHMMKKEIEKLNIPPIREFLQTIHDAGGEIYGCKASVDMFHLQKEDFTPLVHDIITVGEFYEKSAGAQIIFT
jgi:peroxiredoxin family protein